MRKWEAIMPTQTDMECAADRLIAIGDLIHHANKTGCKKALRKIGLLSMETKMLAEMLHHARIWFPHIMFRALMEGWSAFKIREELQKANAQEPKY